MLLRLSRAPHQQSKLQTKSRLQKSMLLLQNPPRNEAGEAPAVTEHVENSKKEEKPEVQPQTPKEEKLVPQDSKNSNQNSEATEPKEEVGEVKRVTAHESQSAVETETVKEETKVEDTVVTADNSNATKEIQVESNTEVETPVGATEEVQGESHVGEKQPEGSKDEEGENKEGELVEDEESKEVEGENEEEEVAVSEQDSEESDDSEGDSEDESECDSEEEEVDGEESDDKDPPGKPLDVDEEHKKPQYIPKREPVARVVPKKMRSELTYRWGYDMFDPNQQVPKSKQEWVDQSGYDIRQEEASPR
ncbi:hypothetical protein DAPPUDRAFT_261213 [Daphnia pulex]|uniref:Protein CASC3 n=1 Tax=Daphnia pulex TaxID=6669 RepID=E9HKQ1_DAPPU|nr:hypothetical protein DAPPUDRAFT_261213 [Daphnia pulex]|eukprot:EFX67698.1 hypothetical protein DAPPUDRAFT_261213 [Daphnia pulex]